MKKNIIITGGMGYIGSHIYVELFNQYNAIIIDNLCNSKEDALQSFPGYVFHNIDLLNKDDFPALTGPTITTLIPCRICCCIVKLFFKKFIFFSISENKFFI